MKKEYIRPELNLLSLVVEDNTNDRIEDNFLSMGKDLGHLFT